MLARPPAPVAARMCLHSACSCLPGAAKDPASLPCPHPAASSTPGHGVLPCSGVRLFVIGVVLPAMATWLLEARARFTFATLFREGEEAVA